MLAASASVHLVLPARLLVVLSQGDGLEKILSQFLAGHWQIIVRPAERLGTKLLNYDNLLAYLSAYITHLCFEQHLTGHLCLLLQQAGGYSGYHGVEHGLADGEAREPEDEERAEALKAEHTGTRPETDGSQAGPNSPSKRAQLDPSSPR